MHDNIPVWLQGPCPDSVDMILQIHSIRQHSPLRWRHSGRDGVSNHKPHDCLLNRLFRRKSKKTSKLRVTGFVGGIHRGPVNSPHKWPVTREMSQFDDVFMQRFYVLSPFAADKTYLYVAFTNLNESSSQKASWLWINNSLYNALIDTSAFRSQ